MSYRPEWWAREAQGGNVLQIALDLHMGASGASDVSREQMAMDHMLLAHIVESWNPTIIEAHRDFDTCVLNLVLAAMEESRVAAIQYPLYGAAITEAAKSVSAWRIQESTSIAAREANNEPA